MRRYVEKGDRAAFQELFERYAGKLKGMFMRHTGDQAVSEDMVQQTFLHFHRARKDFRLDREVRPWLYTIALNVRREYFRRRGRKKEVQLEPVVHGEPTVAPSTTTRSDRLVRRALANLSDQQREVILLHWYEGMSFPEIATTVGASLSAVKVRAHRGYEKLRSQLSESV